MSKISARRINEVFYSIRCEPGIGAELESYFAFRPDGYQFSPKYRNKVWDGYVRLYTRKTPTLYVGLIGFLRKFCSDRGYELDADEPTSNSPSAESIVEFISTMTLSDSRGAAIEPRDYQVDGVVDALTTKRRICISPTSSGKSLMAYVAIRYIIQSVPGVRIIMVVPDVGLVKQMMGDFRDYAKLEGWSVDDHVHPISAGVEKNVDKQVILTTWQSVFRLGSKWFEKFDAAIMDEAHRVAATSLKSIMEALVNASYRIGLTGSMVDSKVNELSLIGLLGEVRKVISTKQLMEDDVVSQFHVEAVRLDYSESDRRKISVIDSGDGTKRKPTYQEEVSFCESHPGKLEIVTAIAESGADKNGLLLFRKIKHGEDVFRAVRARIDSSRKVYLVHGGVDPDERNRIRALIEKEIGSVVVASMGVFSTGINIKNLHYAAFLSMFKSSILTRQSIGRLLRKSPDGRPAVLFDLIDDLDHKSRESFGVRHARARFRIYIEEGFKVVTRRLSVRSWM